MRLVQLAHSWPELLLLGLGSFAITTDVAYLPLYWRATIAMVLFIGVFGTLAHTSDWLQVRIVQFARLWTSNHEQALRAYYLVMRPGVLMHELAHAIFVLLLGGKIIEFSAWETHHRIQGVGSRHGHVRLGHICYTLKGRSRLISRLKGAIIGFAPLPVGVTIIGLILWLQRIRNPTALEPTNMRILEALPWTEALFWVSLFCIIWVANQMMTSSQDRTEWPFALFALTLLALGIVTLWWAIPDAAKMLSVGAKSAFKFLSLLTTVLIVPLIVNTLLGLVLLGMEKLIHRQIK
jgi:hypothetical protein